MSFSLYLLHWPLLKLLRIAGVSVNGSSVALLAAMVLVTLAAAGFAGLTERRRPAIRAWLEHRFDSRLLASTG